MDRCAAPHRGGGSLTGHVRSVNIGRAERHPAGGPSTSGIRKLPTSDPVPLTDPGPRRGDGRSGLRGDFIGDGRHHGGYDQAVYAVAAEELAWWAGELGRDLPDGAFGENVTTTGLDVDAALVGEIWTIGTARLQVSGPRIPCSTFAAAMGEQGWVRRFARRGRTGAYLRVLEPGTVQAGDAIDIVHRPDHDVTTAVVFRAVTTERELLPTLEAAEPDLSDEARRAVEAWHRRQTGP